MFLKDVILYDIMFSTFKFGTWLGGSIINRHSRYSPLIGIITLFPLILVVCVNPFGGIDNQPYENIHDNEINTSAASKIVDNKTNSKSNN